MNNPPASLPPRMVGMGMSQQPQQQQFSMATAASQPQPSQAKEISAASLCRFGQEIIHEVVNKAIEMFALLKQMQLPNGIANTTNYNEYKVKLDEAIRNIAVSFRYLHHIQLKVKEQTAAFDDRPIEELLPVEMDGELLGESPHLSEAYKLATNEQKEVIAQLRTKNRQLKDVIDKLRLTIWEINTMMSTRKILPPSALKSKKPES